MADITITAANVVPDAGYGFQDGTAGVAITAGQEVYKDSSNLYQLADADALLTAASVGTALHSAAANQPLRIQATGTITIGGTSAAGQVYVVSVNPGGIAPYGDLGSGDFVTIVGIGISATKIELIHKVSGIAKA